MVTRLRVARSCSIDLQALYLHLAFVCMATFLYSDSQRKNKNTILLKAQSLHSVSSIATIRHKVQFCCLCHIHDPRVMSHAMHVKYELGKMLGMENLMWSSNYYVTYPVMCQEVSVTSCRDDWYPVAHGMQVLSLQTDTTTRWPCWPLALGGEGMVMVTGEVKAVFSSALRKMMGPRDTMLEMWLLMWPSASKRAGEIVSCWKKMVHLPGKSYPRQLQP